MINKNNLSDLIKIKITAGKTANKIAEELKELLDKHDKKYFNDHVSCRCSKTENNFTGGLILPSDQANSLTEYLRNTALDFSLKNEGENKMYKNDFKTLLGEQNKKEFNITLEDFSTKGFIVKVNNENKTKKEFVDFADDDFGFIIGKLIMDHVKEFKKSKKTEEEIARIEEVIEDNKKYLHELKKKKQNK